MQRIHSDIPASLHREPGTTATPGPRRVMELPVRFHGRAYYALDTEEAVQVLEAALRGAARPEALTAAIVQQYCHEQGIADARMEHAVLREAFRVVSREVLMQRLVSAAGRRLAATAAEEICVESRDGGARPRGSTLADEYRGVALREGRSTILRMSLGSSMELPLAISPGCHGRALRARARRPIPVSGSLRLEGWFAPLHGHASPAQVRVHWRVRRGADWLATRAITPMLSPLDDIVACVGAGALARFAEAVPDHLTALARTDRGPAFVRVERILRLGRVSEQTRAYELFWRRLRDHLLWRVRAGGG